MCQRNIIDNKGSENVVLNISHLAKVKEHTMAGAIKAARARQAKNGN